MKYSGIDLHVNNCVVAVIDKQVRVLYCWRRPNDLGVIIHALEPTARSSLETAFAYSPAVA